MMNAGGDPRGGGGGGGGKWGALSFTSFQTRGEGCPRLLRLMLHLLLEIMMWGAHVQLSQEASKQKAFASCTS